MKRSEYQPAQIPKTPILTKSESGNDRPVTPITRAPKTSDQLFNDQISEQLEYINKHINPILSKLMIRIINEDPKDLVEYMIQYLKSQEELESKNEFNATLSKTISPHKRMNAEGRSERREKGEDQMM